MIETYIEKLEDFATYATAQEFSEQFLARVVQDDLEQIAIGAPYILRVLHAHETYIKELQQEIDELRHQIYELTNNTKL